MDILIEVQALHGLFKAEVNISVFLLENTRLTRLLVGNPASPSSSCLFQYTDLYRVPSPCSPQRAALQTEC